MAEIAGSYIHLRNENLDEYFKVIGVPYIPRKMMLATSPTLEIKSSDEIWTIKTSTMLRTIEIKFKLGQEYEESMPGGVIKSTTTLEEDGKLKTHSIAPNGKRLSRTYEVTEAGCVIIMKEEESGVEARRYFKRV